LLWAAVASFMLAPILVLLLNNCFEIINSLFDLRYLYNSIIESEN
jgi:hypothetical protein